MQDQYKRPQSVGCVSADFYDEYQSDEEAKHNKCLVLNDISWFCCFIMTHQLNFKIIHRPLTRSAVSSWGGQRERRKSTLPCCF